MRRVRPILVWWSLSSFLFVLRHDGGEGADEKAGCYTTPEHNEGEHQRISHGAGLRAITVRRGDWRVRAYILNSFCALCRRRRVPNSCGTTTIFVNTEMMRMVVIGSPFLFPGRRSHDA